MRRVARLDPAQVARKVLRACREGVVDTTTGRQVNVSFQSVCIHSDTPGALDLAKAVRAALDEAGIDVKAYEA